MIADRRLRARQPRLASRRRFERVGVPAVVTQDPRAVDEADAVVLPGDGAFHDAMANLDASACSSRSAGRSTARRPFLGICLGYQLLFSTSEEFGEGRGLDVIPGVVRRLPAGPQGPAHGLEPRGARRRRCGSSRASRTGAHFYFVHSYYPVVAGLQRSSSGLRAVRGRSATYGVRLRALRRGATTVCASRRRSSIGRIYATQFHPEKSQRWGLRLLENFAARREGAAR